MSFVFLNATKPELVNELTLKGHKSYWYYFNYAKKKQFQYIKVFIKLLFLFIKIKPDVVQTNLFDDSLPALYAAKLAQVKKRVITKQDTGYHIKYTPHYIKYDKFNNKNATHIIPVSKETQELILKYEKPDINKVKLIHHAVNEFFFEQYDENIILEIKRKYHLENKKVIGMVARYIESKGYKNAIEAAKYIVASNPDVIFKGVGWGDQESELISLINKYDLANNFVLTGKIDYLLMPSLYKCFDIYLHAADYEPFGFVIAEAMFSKIPIISTKVGAARDVLVHKESAYILESNQPHEIIKNLEGMLTIDTKPMVEKSYSLAKKYFAKKVMWSNYKDIFLS
mgnify:CR=1 FL=1